MEKADLLWIMINDINGITVWFPLNELRNGAVDTAASWINGGRETMSSKLCASFKLPDDYKWRFFNF